MAYCFVTGCLGSENCNVDGLSRFEASSLVRELRIFFPAYPGDTNTFKASVQLLGAQDPVLVERVRRISFKEAPEFVINVLRMKFGYKVVTTIVNVDSTCWTMERL